MKHINLVWFGLLIGTLLLAACQSSTSPRVLGKVDVKGEQLEGQLPRQAPSVIYVEDFALEAEDFQKDEGVRGMLPGRLRERAGSRLGSGISGPLAAGDAASQAREIVTTMSSALVKSFSENGMAARAFNPAIESLPRNGWLVSGVFTEVDEGNRLKRAAIGFGRGATQMDVQVMVSDLGSSNSTAPFVIFGTVKDPGKVPGAVVTMNPYVAAAKFVLEKNATGRDIEKTAGQIVKEVLKFKDRH
ncbi:MAG: DUF4410 domain-containing protein [Methylomonas sp.]